MTGVLLGLALGTAVDPDGDCDGKALGLEQFPNPADRLRPVRSISTKVAGSPAARKLIPAIKKGGIVSIPKRIAR